MRLLFYFLAVAVPVLTLAGCSAAPLPTTSPGPTAASVSGNLTVFAASSLTDAFNGVKIALAAKYPKLTITYSFAGSSTLRTQLEQGATADVFASANTQQMDLAVQSGVVASGESALFAANRLVVVVPTSDTKVQTLADLAKPGLKLVLAQKDVPVGGYARDAISKMDASGQYGAGFSQKVLANLVSEESNVKQALAKVALGEADAAIVYSTDVTKNMASQVTVLAIPDAQNVVAAYPIALVKAGKQPELAQRFISYVLSPEGQAILKRYGFMEVPQ